MLEKTLESPLDCKEIQLVHSKGDQSWVFTGRTDAKAETPILWPPDAKSWLIGKDSDAGRDWGQEEKEMTEDEMARWHHRLDGHEFGWTPGVGDGQGGLVCCDSWGYKESDTTERLNWTEINTCRLLLFFHVNMLLFFSFLFLLEYNCFMLLCHILLYSKVSQPYVYIYPFFFGFPSHLGHYRAPSRVPCAIYNRFSLVISFIHSKVYMSILILQFIPPLGIFLNSIPNLLNHL